MGEREDRGGRCTSPLAAAPLNLPSSCSVVLTLGPALTGLRKPFPTFIPSASCEPQSLCASPLVLWSLFVSFILLTPLSVVLSFKSPHLNYLETTPFPAETLTHALTFSKALAHVLYFGAVLRTGPPANRQCDYNWPFV